MDFTNWFPFKLNKGKANKQKSDFVGICMLPDGVILAHSRQNEQGRSVLQRCEFYPSNQVSSVDEAKWLSHIIDNYHFKNCDYAWILLPGDYQLIMLEPPDLPEDEVKESILWHVKEYIDFPLTDVIVDTCDIPEFGIANKRMIYAVVGEEPGLSPSLHLLRASGMEPTIVDITEFALRNLSNLFAQGDESIVLVSLTQYYCALTISRDNYLYFSRRIELEIEQLDDHHIKEMQINLEVEPPGAFETLITDIQQSIHYFQTQMGQQAPTSIVFTPMPFRTQHLKSYLESELDVSIVFPDLNEVMNTEQELTPEIQSRCLPVLGGILRPEGRP